MALIIHLAKSPSVIIFKKTSYQTVLKTLPLSVPGGWIT